MKIHNVARRRQRFGTMPSAEERVDTAVQARRSTSHFAEHHAFASNATTAGMSFASIGEAALLR
jgi:hypothetical protein